MFSHHCFYTQRFHRINGTACNWHSFTSIFRLELLPVSPFLAPLVPVLLPFPEYLDCALVGREVGRGLGREVGLTVGATEDRAMHRSICSWIQSNSSLTRA